MSIHRRHELAELRRDLGFSQESLADHLDIGRTTVGRWERHEGGVPRPALAARLAQTLGVNASELRRLFGEDEPPEEQRVLDDGQYRTELLAPIDRAELGDLLKGRLIQIALDVSTIDEAIRLAQIAARGGADLIEVGDPIIKRFGMGAVAEIREAVPGMPTVVEFASSDWVDEQVDMAADAGADIVFVLGIDHPSRVERAVRAARARRVGIVLALPAHAEPGVWCSMVEDAGVDAISLIRNIDSADSISASRIREVASTVSAPLIISGGFGPYNINEVIDDAWSVVIVGGAFINSRDPSSVLTSMRSTLGLAR